MGGLGKKILGQFGNILPYLECKFLGKWQARSNDF